MSNKVALEQLPRDQAICSPRKECPSQYICLRYVTKMAMNRLPYVMDGTPFLNEDGRCDMFLPIKKK